MLFHLTPVKSSGVSFTYIILIITMVKSNKLSNGSYSDGGLSAAILVVILLIARLAIADVQGAIDDSRPAELMLRDNELTPVYVVTDGDTRFVLPREAHVGTPQIRFYRDPGDVPHGALTYNVDFGRSMFRQALQAENALRVKDGNPPLKTLTRVPARLQVDIPSLAQSTVGFKSIEWTGDLPLGATETITLPLDRSAVDALAFRRHHKDLRLNVRLRVDLHSARDLSIALNPPPVPVFVDDPTPPQAATITLPPSFPRDVIVTISVRQGDSRWTFVPNGRTHRIFGLGPGPLSIRVEQESGPNLINGVSLDEPARNEPEAVIPLRVRMANVLVAPEVVKPTPNDVHAFLVMLTEADGALKVGYWVREELSVTRTIRVLTRAGRPLRNGLLIGLDRSHRPIDITALRVEGDAVNTVFVQRDKGTTLPLRTFVESFQRDVARERVRATLNASGPADLESRVAEAVHQWASANVSDDLAGLLAWQQKLDAAKWQDLRKPAPAAAALILSGAIDDKQAMAELGVLDHLFDSAGPDTVLVTEAILGLGERALHISGMSQAQNRAGKILLARRDGLSDCQRSRLWKILDVLHVPGYFPDLAGAIRASRSGHRIELGPGTFRVASALTIGHDLSIHGDAKLGTILTIQRGASLKFHDGRVHLQWLTLDGESLLPPSRPRGALIGLFRNSGTIDGITITGGSGDGMALHDVHDLRIHNALVRACPSDGIAVLGGENVEMTDVRVTENGGSGLMIAEGTRNLSLIRGSAVANRESGISTLGAIGFRLEEYRLETNGGDGARFKGSATFSVSRIVAIGNAHNGLEARQGATGKVLDSTFRENAWHGLSLRAAGHPNAAIELRKNECEQNGKSGIALDEGTFAEVIANQAKHNREAGLLSQESITHAEDNTFAENAEGIVIDAGPDDRLVKNHCVKNRGYGLVIRRHREGAGPSLSLVENTARQNATDGIHIDDGGSIRLERNAASENMRDGIVILGSRTEAEAIGNVITENKRHGLAVDLSARLTARDNRSCSNKGDGFFAGGKGSQTRFEGNIAENNARTGFHAENGTVVWEGNSATNNGYGFAASENALIKSTQPRSNRVRNNGTNVLTNYHPPLLIRRARYLSIQEEAVDAVLEGPSILRLAGPGGKIRDSGQERKAP